MFLVTFMSMDDQFVAEIMRMWQIADLWGMSDCNMTRDHKVYRLSPDKEPELLEIREGRHCIALYTKAGEQVTEYYDWPEH